MAEISIEIENRKITKELTFMGKTYTQVVLLVQGTCSCNIAALVYEDFPDCPMDIKNRIADIALLNSFELEKLVEDMKYYEQDWHEAHGSSSVGKETN